jgi:putative ABC transport system permease protein
MRASLLRTLLRSPAFTITAIAALALGIGANTAIFSVVNAVLLRPLTFPDPDRIVQFFLTTPAGPDYGGSATRFNVLRQQTDLLQDFAAYEYNAPSLNLTGGAYPEQIHGINVSADYFRLLGAPIIEGRTFSAEEDRPGGGRVAVLSYGFWQRRFAADPQIAGKTISLSGVPYSVIGVVGPGFNTELDTPPDLWLPFQIDPDSTDQARYFSVLARLKPGATLVMVNDRLSRAADEFRSKFPGFMGPRDRFAVLPYPEAIVSGVRSSLLILSGAVSFVLLIACANVANLLLIRAAGRKREMALRAALGASRGRIVRQLLLESMLLSGVGGALGLLLGLAGVRAILAVNPANLPRLGAHGAAVTMDWRVLSFTILVSLVTGIAFGLIPALETSRVDLNTTLRGTRGNKARSLLVASEVAFALVLLVGSALLIRTFVALREVNPGFDARNVLTMRMSLAGSRFKTTADVNRLVRDAVRRIEALPGVASAGVTYNLPLEGGLGIPFNIAGRTPANGRYDGRGWLNVSPGYFEIFKIPVLRGRVFTDRDDAGTEPVAIVNQAMARQFWPNGDPLADRVLLGKGYGPEFEEPARRIVGVIADIHNEGLNREPSAMVYVPAAQVTDGITALAGRAASLAWIVRVRSDSSSLTSAIQIELTAASGGLPVASVHSMDDIVSQSTAREDFNALLMTIFGGAALLLAAVGVYGLMAYSVELRTREIGIRLALGAASSSVQNMVVLQGMRLVLTGVGIGMAAAVALSRILAGFLFGVQARDPLVFLLVPVVLIGVGFLAVWLPARRASLVDPINALRHEGSR